MEQLNLDKAGRRKAYGDWDNLLIFDGKIQKSKTTLQALANKMAQRIHLTVHAKQPCWGVFDSPVLF